MNQAINLLRFSVSDGRRLIEGAGPDLVQAIFDSIESRIYAVETHKGLNMKHELGQDFGNAFCKHFGLPGEQVGCPVVIHNNPGELFRATVTILMTADDLAGISAIMQARHKPSADAIADNLEQVMDGVAKTWDR